MADLVVLVWFTMNVFNLEAGIQGPEISQRTFETHQECAMFVTLIANGKPIVNENYEFGFATPDGTLFRGGCYNAEQYEKKFKKSENK